VITVGNEAMITVGHLIDYLVDDEHTRAIAVFMEGIREPEVFAAAARRAAEAGKAVVVLKAGRSELAARTAASHTGALVGDDRVVDAVFARHGVIRVDTIESMLVTAGVAAHTGPLARPGWAWSPSPAGPATFSRTSPRPLEQPSPSSRRRRRSGCAR